MHVFCFVVDVSSRDSQFFHRVKKKSVWEGFWEEAQGAEGRFKEVVVGGGGRGDGEGEECSPVLESLKEWEGEGRREGRSCCRGRRRRDEGRFFLVPLSVGRFLGVEVQGRGVRGRFGMLEGKEER